MGHEEVQSLAWPETLGSGTCSLCDGRNCFFLSPGEGLWSNSVSNFWETAAGWQGRLSYVCADEEGLALHCPLHISRSGV